MPCVYSQLGKEPRELPDFLTFWPGGWSEAFKGRGLGSAAQAPPDPAPMTPPRKHVAVQPVALLPCSPNPHVSSQFYPGSTFSSLASASSSPTPTSDALVTSTVAVSQDSPTLTVCCCGLLCIIPRCWT